MTCFFSPKSEGLAFSPAEVDVPLPPEDAEGEGWVEVVEDIPSTGKSGFCIQSQHISYHRTVSWASNADISTNQDNILNYS